MPPDSKAEIASSRALSDCTYIVTVSARHIQPADHMVNEGTAAVDHETNLGRRSAGSETIAVLALCEFPHIQPGC